MRKSKRKPHPLLCLLLLSGQSDFLCYFFAKKGKLYKKNISNVTSFIFFYNSKHTLSVSSLEDAMGAEASC
jgi:hypothetical protein